MENNIAVVAIIVKDLGAVEKINALLHDFGDYIVGRMGVPDKEHDVYVISIIIKATVEIISAMTGKLGRIENVTVKSAVTNVEV